MDLDKAIADVRRRVQAESRTPPPLPVKRRSWLSGFRKGPFIVLAIFAYAIAKSDDPAKPKTDGTAVYGWKTEAPPPGRIVTTPGPSVRDLEVADFKWSLQGFGNVMMLDSVTVKNKSAIAWKDVAVVCELFGKSGTKVGSTFRVMYDVVPASGKKRFRNINMGIVSDQAANAGCEIVSAARGS